MPTITLDKRTPEERRAMQQKGGRMSGISKRRTKSMREILKNFIEIPIKEINDEQLRKTFLTAAGTGNEDFTVKDLVVTGLLVNSVGGDSRMMKLLLEMLGEDRNLKLKQDELRLKKRIFDGKDGGTKETSAGMLQLAETLKLAGGT